MDDVLLITGSSGIAEATALLAGREGYKVFIAGLDESQCRDLSARIEGSGYFAGDLREPSAADGALSGCVEHFGRVDVLVNNAGWAPARTALARMSEADMDRVLAVNLRAPIALARLAAAAMTAQGGGAIGNISSAAARNTPGGGTVYAAAKAGLIAFTLAAFAELRRGKTKVSVVVPGLVDTGLIPNNKRLNRAAMLRAEDVADAVMQIVRAPAHACPIEVVLEPQIDPIR